MSRFYNRTRRSPSIPAKLLRENKLYLVPVYYLLRTSELAGEGIRNSGSYRFADHIYAGRPKGKYLIGYIVDAALLRMKSARSFRARYLYAKAEIHKYIRSRAEHAARLDILAVPSGLARELFEVAQELKDAGDPMYHRVGWHGFDLDPELVDQLSVRVEQSGHDMAFWCADALRRESYRQAYDMVVSLGFGEFLEDGALVEFYRLVHESLRPGGFFVTSGMMAHRFSDYLLRNIGELHTHYRSASQLRAVACAVGFNRFRTYGDPHGLQSMLITAKD